MRYKYREIEEGGDINLATAISQSVQAIELAAAIAADTKDIDSLIKISSTWLDFGERVSHILEDMDEEEGGDNPVRGGPAKPYGFHQQNSEIKEGEDKDGESKC